MQYRVYICLGGVLISLSMVLYCALTGSWGWALVWYAVAFDEVRDLTNVQELPNAV